MDAVLMFLGIVIPFMAIAALSRVESDSLAVNAAIGVSAVALLGFVAWLVTG